MAAPPSPSPAAPDYFSGRPTPRRPAPSVTQSRLAPGTPGLPRTPLLGRSISAQFGSPGSFRAAEQEDIIVYEISERHVAAGFAGESRPRCAVRFTPETGRREGDYRQYDPRYNRRNVGVVKEKEGREDEDYVLYRTDLRSLDLGLVSDKLDRAVRQIHSDHLQLDAKPRKAVLAIPSLLPTPLLEVMLKVLFTHYTQPPAISILTTPILSCVSAGLRDALVVELGWEETTVTAVGEYKSISQRRSTRAGKALVQKVRTQLSGMIGEEGHESEVVSIPFAHAEDVVERMVWLKPFGLTHEQKAALQETQKLIPLPEAHSEPLPISLKMLSYPAESVFFTHSSGPHDDEDLPLHQLAYRCLLSLPLDLRATCLSRIIITTTAGPGSSFLPGFKQRFLAELDALIQKRGWDAVSSYGSAKTPLPKTSRALRERSANTAALPPPPTSADPPSSPIKKPTPTQQDIIPPSQRPHDDLTDPISMKAERNHGIGRHGPSGVKAEVRGVETLGAWAGASLAASLRVKGAHEVEREEWVRGGFREGGGVW